MKVALVYDRVNKWGGAEKVLLALNELFPKAPLYTSLYNKKHTSWAKVFPEVIPTYLQKISFIHNIHQKLPMFMPFAFESFNFNKYDLVISVTSEFAKAIITKPNTIHICYCLTPTRYLWSHYDEYFKGNIFKGIAKPIVNYLRKYDYITAQRPDFIIAISHEVQNRIKKYYNRDSTVIFPPATVKHVTNHHLPVTNHIKKYYLIVSRLEPYKKVDLVLDTFSGNGIPLVVVGSGSLEKKYKSKYKDKRNIHLMGFVNEKDLEIIYHNATAFIMPQEEDFGISAVEAQSHGIPVIAFKKGGSLDTVIDNKTGIFFKEQSVESLQNAVIEFERLHFSKKDLYNNASNFTKQEFKNKFEKFVKSVI